MNFFNDSELIENGTTTSNIDESFVRNWWYLLFSIIPLVCFFGNFLVCLAVCKYNSLQTPTNYLLFSLAIADLFIGVAVMPFSIHLSINNLHWHMPVYVCYIYCASDVAASTSSIVHLVLISIDRLVAATKPAEYKTIKHRRRVYIAIALAWSFSIGLSLPLGADFNGMTEYHVRTNHHCGIYSPIYMLCSSIFAFYLPCFIMSLTYGYIFYTLRKRLRAIQLQEIAGGRFLGFGADVSNITTSAIETVTGVAARNRNMISWEKPLLRKIEETAAEHASSLDDSEREQLQIILDRVRPSSSFSQGLDDDIERPPSVVLEAVTFRGLSETLSTSTGLEVPRNSSFIRARRRFSDALQAFNQTSKSKNVNIGFVNVASLRRHSYQPQSTVNCERPNRKQKNLHRLSEMISDWERPSKASLFHMYSFAHRESVYTARKKLAGLKDWALNLLAKLKSRQGMAICREARATKLVATVMFIFLVCWLPFFTLNMIKAYKLIYNTWSSELERLFHWFTALGYLNSSLNFFIYSAINQRFRSTFRKILDLKHQNKSWMLPAKEVARRRAKYECGCEPFPKVKNMNLQKANVTETIDRRFLVNQPKIIIDEISVNNFFNSKKGNTTFRHSSENPIHRSLSEVIDGTIFSPNLNSRRGSNKSSNLAALQLHQISAQNSDDVEIFV